MQVSRKTKEKFGISSDPALKTQNIIYLFWFSANCQDMKFVFLKNNRESIFFTGLVCGKQKSRLQS